MSKPAETSASVPVSTETAGPGRKRVNLLIAAVVCASLVVAYAARRRATAPGETQTGPTTVTDAERVFVGRWSSTHTKGPGLGVMIMKADNTYVAICKRDWIMNCDGYGKWSLRDRALVWDSESNPVPQDVNPIVEFAPDRFVIKELDGTLTVFARLP